MNDSHAKSTPLKLLVPLALVGAHLAFSPVATAETLTRYRLDPSRTRFVAHLLKGGVGARFAHDHVVRARRLRGEITLRQDAWTSASVKIEADARSLEPDAPALRRSYGMKTMLDKSDRAKVRANLHAKDQLHTARYPTIRFTSTEVKATKRPGYYQIRGKLSLRGRTRTVALVAKVSRAGATIKASGSLVITQSDFGYKPYSAGLGLVRVKDRLTLNLYLEARRLAK